MTKKEIQKAGQFQILFSSPQSQAEWNSVLSTYEEKCNEIFAGKNIAVVSFAPKKSIFKSKRSICFSLNGIERVNTSKGIICVNFLGSYNVNRLNVSRVIHDQEFELGLLALVSYTDKSTSFIKHQIDLFNSCFENNRGQIVEFGSDFVFLNNDASCFNWFSMVM